MEPNPGPLSWEKLPLHRKNQALEVGSSVSYEDNPGLDTWGTNTERMRKAFGNIRPSDSSECSVQVAK